jgi:NitT/TauT family transport system ATP-binding protein
MKITVDNLHVTYPARGRAGPVEALRGAALHVADGELACVVGPSGCGKTTLLRVLAGLEQPTSGGYVIRHDDPSRPRQGVVFQGAGLFPWLTVEQNVAYGLQMRGVAPGERAAIAREWIARIGLERFAQSYPAQLSGGMQQRVGLARAFAYGPEVLLMDEPFGALDAQTRLVLQQTLLHQIEREARAVLFITHSIEEALTLGDTLYVMSARPGRVLARFEVPFARPRDAVALRSEPRFAALFGEVWAALRDEVDRARQEEAEHDPHTAIGRR